MAERTIIKTGGSWMGLLGVILVVLKVLNVIDLAWVWVLMPFWFGFAVFFLIIIATFLCAVLAEVFK
jgi:hypothetical protein